MLEMGRDVALLKISFEVLEPLFHRVGLGHKIAAKSATRIPVLQTLCEFENLCFGICVQ